MLPFDKKNRLDEWSKMVRVSKNLELGVITVTVKSNSQSDAARIMDGLSDVLIQQNTCSAAAIRQASKCACCPTDH
ncbi:MAG: hypothetical protein WDN67_03935 [Candidatus Moraniibacteriota bacterium]